MSTEAHRTTDETSGPVASSAHTPGPWEVDAVMGEDAHEICLANPPEGAGNPVIVASVFHDEDHGGFPISKLQADANARLIAAAPDLLALAEQYAAECSECAGSGKIEMLSASGHPAGEIDCPDCADIRAVIAKAKGGSGV